MSGIARSTRRRNAQRLARTKRIAGATVLAASSLAAGYLQSVRQMPSAYASVPIFCGGFGASDDSITTDDSLVIAIQDFNSGISGCNTIAIAYTTQIDRAGDDSIVFPDDTSTLAIVGSGLSVINGSLDPMSPRRALEVTLWDDQQALSISSLSLMNGLAPNEGDPYTYGGALRVYGSGHGRVDLYSVELRDSAADYGGGADIRVNELYLDQVTVAGNSAQHYGGGLWLTARDTVTIEYSLFGGIAGANTAEVGGGGVYARAGDAINVSFSSFEDDSTGGKGGAAYLYSPYGGISISDSDFDSNDAGDDSTTGKGGAAYLGAPNGRIYIANSTFTGNYSPYSGGAVFAGPYSDITIDTESEFDANYAFMRGGAVFVYGGDVDIHDSVFSDNWTNDDTRGYGGAIYVLETPSVYIESSVFTGNYTKGVYGVGGALYAASSVYVQTSDFGYNHASAGGAIYANYLGYSEVERSRFYGNTATDSGGAIFVSSGMPLDVIGSTFRGNAAWLGGAIRKGGTDPLRASYSSFLENQSVYPQVTNPDYLGIPTRVAGGSAIAGYAVQITNSTIAGNVSAVPDDTSVGGAVALYGGTAGPPGGSLNLIFSTISGNTSADDTTPSSVFTIPGSHFSAVGTVIDDTTGGRACNTLGTQDDTYSFATLYSDCSFNGVGSDDTFISSLSSSYFQFGPLDYNYGYSENLLPAASSVLVSRAPASMDDSLGTGITEDQRNLSRAGLRYTIGSVQVLSTPTPSAANSTLGALPASVVADGASLSTITATVLDDSMNVVPGQDVYFDITSGTGALSSGPWTTDGSGVATATVSSSIAGPVVITAYLGTSASDPAITQSATVTFTAPGPGPVPTPTPTPTPTPSPQPLPGPVAPGGSVLTVNGVPDPNLSVVPNATDNGLDVTGNGWSMRVDGLGPDGKPLALGPSSTLVLDAERQVRSSGSGFLPDTKVDLYMDPPVLLQTGTTGSWLRDAVLRAAKATLLGTFTVAADGTFTGTATLPDSILAGEHVLQAVGISPQRQTRAVSLGILVRPWIELAKGPRQADGRYDRIRATGDTGGIEAGVKVTPHIRYRGQSDFSQGKAVITVATDGTFTWSRKIRPDKGLAAYIAYTDTDSNKVFWAKVR